MKRNLLLAGLLACCLSSHLRAQNTGNSTITSPPTYTKAGNDAWLVHTTTTTIAITATSKDRTTVDHVGPVDKTTAATLDAAIAGAAAVVDKGAVVSWTVTGKIASGLLAPGTVIGTYTVNGIKKSVGPVNIPTPNVSTSSALGKTVGPINIPAPAAAPPAK